MLIFDLARRERGRNRLQEGRALALDGEQVLIVSSGGGGLLLDTDLLRLSRTVARLSVGSPKLAIQRGAGRGRQRGGLFVVSLDAAAVERARREGQAL